MHCQLAFEIRNHLLDRWLRTRDEGLDNTREEKRGTWGTRVKNEREGTNEMVDNNREGNLSDNSLNVTHMTCGALWQNMIWETAALWFVSLTVSRTSMAMS